MKHIGKGIGLGLSIGLGAPSGFIAEYKTVYNSFTTKPSASVADAQNTMVKSLVDAGVWNKLDVLYLFAQESNGDSEALKNWINPGTYDATIPIAPSFVSLEGFTGNGSSQFINTNWNVKTDSTNFILNDASCWGYLRTRKAVDNTVATEWGCEVGSDNCIFIGARNGSYAALNDGQSSTVTGNATTGMHIINRTANNAKIYYVNNAINTSSVEVSTAIPDAEMYILADHDDGVTRYYIADTQVSAWGAGSSLSEANRNSLQDAIEAYMDSNGKGVIT